VDLIPSKNYTAKPTGLEIDPLTDINSWLKIGELLRGVTKSIQFWIGDWVLFGESRFGEMYSQGLGDKEFTKQYISDVKYVSKHVSPENRVESLSFEHHRAIAPLPPEKQREWLSRAFKGGLSARALREEISPKQLKGPTLKEEAERAYQFLFGLNERNVLPDKDKTELKAVLKGLEGVLK